MSVIIHMKKFDLVFCRYYIFSKPILLCAELNFTMDTNSPNPIYYKHASRCGSGGLVVVIKLEGNNITIKLSNHWMGGKDNKTVELRGEYLPLGEQTGVKHGIIQVFNEKMESIQYDAYIFEKPMNTEWLQHQDKYVCNLYCASGCSMTVQFQLHMNLNKSTNWPKSMEECDFAHILDGLKYEISDEQAYNKINLKN